MAKIIGFPKKKTKDSESRIKGEEYIKESRPFRPIEREIQHEVVV